MDISEMKVGGRVRMYRTDGLYKEFPYSRVGTVTKLMGNGALVRHDRHFMSNHAPTFGWGAGELEPYQDRWYRRFISWFLDLAISVVPRRLR